MRTRVLGYIIEDSKHEMSRVSTKELTDDSRLGRGRGRRDRLYKALRRIVGLIVNIYYSM